MPAAGTVEFEPGGYHLMCMKPKPAMKPGAHGPGDARIRGRHHSSPPSSAVKDGDGK